MTAPRWDGAPIEVHLEDGGQVILEIEDPATRLGEDADRLIGTLLRADGSEHDVERAIASEADELGLHCVTAPGEHPTVLVLRR
jgi:hypothetical protein